MLSKSTNITFQLNPNSLVAACSRPVMFTSDQQKAPLQFLPHEKFIESVKAGEFIEYRVVDSPEMHYVGVRKRAIKEAINSGSTCLMLCQPKVGME